VKADNNQNAVPALKQEPERRSGTTTPLAVKAEKNRVGIGIHIRDLTNNRNEHLAYRLDENASLFS
jgi:hypothetical protein